MNFEPVNPPESTQFRIEVKLQESRIHGKGLFSTKGVPEGTQVCVWGGRIFSAEEYRQGMVLPHTGIQISEDKWLGSEDGTTRSEDDFMNHSCDPNTYIRGSFSIFAKRNIAENEELTADYSTWLNDLGYVLCNCCCGSRNCRGTISGIEWRDRSYGAKNFRYFSDYVQSLWVNMGDTRYSPTLRSG